MFKKAGRLNISITTVFIALNMLMLFFNGSKFFNLGEYFYFMFLVIVIGIARIFYKGHFSYERVHQSILYILVYIFINVFMFGKGAASDMLLATLLCFAFLFIVCSLNFNIKEIRFLTNSYILSAVILSTILLIQLRQPYFQYGILRFGIFYSETDFYDINFTAAFMLVPGLLAFNKAINRKNQKLFYLLSTLIIFTAIILTGSRGAIIPFIAVAISQAFRDKKFSISYVLIFLVVAIGIILFLPEEIFTRIFSDSYLDSSNSKRIDDWLYGWNAFLNSPFIGHGLHSSFDIIYRELGVGATVHNTFFVIFVQYGLIGAIPNIFLLIYPYFNISKIEKKGILKYIYLSFIFSIIMIEANVTAVYIIPLSFFYIVLNFVKRSKEYTINDIID